MGSSFFIMLWGTRNKAERLKQKFNKSWVRRNSDKLSETLDCYWAVHWGIMKRAKLSRSMLNLLIWDPGYSFNLFVTCWSICICFSFLILHTFCQSVVEALWEVWKDHELPGTLLNKCLESFANLGVGNIGKWNFNRIPRGKTNSVYLDLCRGVYMWQMCQSLDWSKYSMTIEVLIQKFWFLR